MGKFSLFECPECHKTTSAGSWNSATVAYVATNKLRAKMRTKIQDAGNAPTLSYACPECKMLSTKNRIRGRFASEQGNL